MDKEALRKAMLQAQSMQLDLVHAQDELARTSIEGKSSDSKVRIVMNAYGDFKKVEIDPTALVDGIHAMEKAVLEALNNATHKAAEHTKTKLENISKQIGL